MTPRVASRAQPETANEDMSRRERILAAAIQQFADKGFAAVRIDEVAASAGANKQLIYYYFNNKAGLYEAVLERMVELMAPVWARIEDAPSLEDAVERMQVRTQPGTTWARLLAWEGAERGAQGPIHLEAARTASLAHLTSVVRRGKDRGELRRDADAETLALLILTTTSTHVVLPQVAKMLTSIDPDSEEFAARQTALLKQILASLRP